MVRTDLGEDEVRRARVGADADRFQVVGEPSAALRDRGDELLVGVGGALGPTLSRAASAGAVHRPGLAAGVEGWRPGRAARSDSPRAGPATECSLVRLLSTTVSGRPMTLGCGLVDEVHERLVDDERAARSFECCDGVLRVQHAGRVAGVRHEDEVGVVGDAREREPVVRAAAQQLGGVTGARSAAGPSPNTGATIAVRVCRLRARRRAARTPRRRR